MSDLAEMVVPKTLLRGRPQSADFVDSWKPDCESPKSSDFGSRSRRLGAERDPEGSGIPTHERGGPRHE